MWSHLNIKSRKPKGNETWNPFFPKTFFYGYFFKYYDGDMGPWSPIINDFSRSRQKRLIVLIPSTLVRSLKRANVSTDALIHIPLFTVENMLKNIVFISKFLFWKKGVFLKVLFQFPWIASWNKLTIVDKISQKKFGAMKIRHLKTSFCRTITFVRGKD